MIESKTKEIYVGAAMVVIALLGWLVVIPAGIDVPSSVQFRALSPDFWPYIIMGMLGVSGAIVFVVAYLERKAMMAAGNEDEPADPEAGALVEHPFQTRVLRSLFGMACLFAFYVAIGYLGVVVSSIAVVLVLTTALGQRNWKRVVPMAVLLPILLYFFFVYVAQVPMPLGVFENYL